MKCPNCQHQFAPEKIGSTVYWKCPNCGALWFDNKESDFLSLEEAESLAKSVKKASFSQIEYRCPRDQAELKYDAPFLRCFSCGGVLASAQAVKEEKHAKALNLSQDSKRPFTLEQLKYVTILSSVAVFLGINYFLVKNLNTKITTASQAAEIGTNLTVRPVSSNKLALYFATEQPYRTSALFKNSQQQWQQVISSEPSNNHFLIINRPAQNTEVQIRLTSPQGEVEYSKPVEIKL